MSILAASPVPVKPATPSRHTRAAEIPPNHPFGDWDDDDFRQYEEYLMSLHQADAADEAEADAFAANPLADPYPAVACCDRCGGLGDLLDGTCGDCADDLRGEAAAEADLEAYEAEMAAREWQHPEIGVVFADDVPSADCPF